MSISPSESAARSAATSRPAKRWRPFELRAGRPIILRIEEEILRRGLDSCIGQLTQSTPRGNAENRIDLPDMNTRTGFRSGQYGTGHSAGFGKRWTAFEECRDTARGMTDGAALED